ncbi:unnamed protein product [Chondrus crispus]|uniref:Uncharacterized protein n=1 Tax=Chondrus crispus TaxID=2769 RepID=R7QPZ4_CHOCR|nr:unnamed protein product [Chondrus crispus]CDF40184.1 unnamed protein product [Chondrus crispus]|eukprot:XP_005710478.1 unnamed protein product [Chondrus crispus]
MPVPSRSLPPQCRSRPLQSRSPSLCQLRAHRTRLLPLCRPDVRLLRKNPDFMAGWVDFRLLSSRFPFPSWAISWAELRGGYLLASDHTAFYAAPPDTGPSTTSSTPPAVPSLTHRPAPVPLSFASEAPPSGSRASIHISTAQSS